MNLYEREVIKALEKKYGFMTKKTLGQNFLVDKEVIDNIVLGSEMDEETLAIEIGPGLGVITKELCKKAGRVIAIELDKNLIPILNDLLSEYDNYIIINEDVLKVNFNEIISESLNNNESLKKVRIIGNLPYYITTPIIMKILEDNVKCNSITVMMQKEVADRIKAKNSSKEYGALSIAVQYYSEIEKICDASKECFIPKPEVDSTVLRLTIRDEEIANVKDKKLFFKVVKGGFSQRRKTLLNSLQTIPGYSKEEVKLALEKAGIDYVRRAETLTIEEFAKLADSFFEIKG